MKRVVSVILSLVLIFSVCPTVSAAAVNRDTSYEESLAYKLKALGLFKGVSDTDFDLDREPKRIEAVIMLIRLLGKEAEALGGTWAHPFTDVPSWAGADQYVGYAYQKGLTKGMGATVFGSSNVATVNMYLTFVLRSLGYSDTDNVDFSYSNPFSLAISTGILPSGVNTENFWRADVVVISYAALSASLKNSTSKLSDSLIAGGVFSASAFAAYYDASLLGNSGTKEMTATEIYKACAPAVFYIVVYDSKGNPMATGSGFFISSSGVAVTNYHVISGCSSAKITLPVSGAVYDVTGVYAFSRSEDWAVLQVAGSGFSALQIGDSSKVAGGERIYAIGNPLGLESSISEGIVSNPRRVIENLNYLQITAAISSGSSGGALINAYGKVIGITTSTIQDPDSVSQNLNLAVPISYIAGYSTAKITPFSELNSAVKVTITAATSSVAVTVGNTVSVNITITADDQYLNDNLAAMYEIGDKTIADAGWAPYWNGDTCTFYITGLKPGATQIIVKSDINDISFKLNVTVTAGASSANYYGTNIPLYQAITGRSCSSTVYDSESYSIGYVPSGYLYCYDLNDTEVAVYRAYLLSAGFTFYGTENYEDGIEYIYYKGYYAVYVYIDSEYNEVWILPD